MCMCSAGWTLALKGRAQTLRAALTLLGDNDPEWLQRHTLNASFFRRSSADTPADGS